MAVHVAARQIAMGVPTGATITLLARADEVTE